MPQDVKPSDLLQTVPSANGAFCGRFADLLKFPALFAALYTYERNEQGDITPEFCADINLCIASGVAPDGGPGDGTPGTLPTPTVSATDGLFTDKIVVTWGAVTGATRYEVWRGLTSDVIAATKLANVNLATTYTDQGSGVDPSTVYFYFVRAFNDTPAQSNFSLGDSGYEGTLLVTLPGVTDLEASKGFYPYFSAGSAAGPGGFPQPVYAGGINLRWTNVAGAQAYDIYRHTSDDYTTATRIVTGATFAAPRIDSFGEFAFDTIINNGGDDLSYHDSVRGQGLGDLTVVTNYYYWVVPKRSNPATTGPFSNLLAGALGWAVGQGQEILPIEHLSMLLSGGASIAIPAGATKAWVHVQGSYAAGAGGGGSGDGSLDQTGGGGGGAGAAVTGLMTVAAAGKFRLVSVPEADPSSTAAHTDGADGPVTKLQYSALGTFADTIDVVVCAAPGGGKYIQVPGPYQGGAGATATVDASLTPSYIKNGHAGFANVGGTGGHSGYTFGFGKGPGAIFGGTNPTTGNFGGANAQQGHAGGGAYLSAQAAALASGCPGVRGGALIVFYA